MRLSGALEIRQGPVEGASDREMEVDPLLHALISDVEKLYARANDLTLLM